MDCRITYRIPCLALLAALISAPAPLVAGGQIAEVVCAPRDQMVDRLRKAYGAEVQGLGLRGDDAVIEVWADSKGDWTLVQNWASGQPCILAMGVAWDGAGQPPT